MAGETSPTEAATYPRGFSQDTDWKWPMVPARNLVTLNYGRALKADIRNPGKVPVFGTNGQCGWHDEPLSKAPGLILGRKGQGPLGVEWCDKDFWVIDTAYYASILTPNVDLKYLYHLVKYVGLNHLKDGTSNPTLSRDTFGAQLFPLPPLAEQKAIAGILGALDDKIELNRRMNATLEAMARALFQSWFIDFDPVRRNMDRIQNQPSPPAPLPEVEGSDPVRRNMDQTQMCMFSHPSLSGRRDGDEGSVEAIDRLFPDSFQDSPLGPIPKGWEIGTIQGCCVKIQNGGTPRRNEPRFWEGGHIPWLASGEVRQSIITATDGSITEEGLTQSSAKWVPALSTVVALYGATAGRVSLTSCRLTTNQAVCALIPKKDFALFNYLTMSGATAELENKAVGSAQQNISKGIVEETKVVLPTPALVGRFANLVSPVFERWISNLHQSRTLATLRDTLLPKLLSGEITTTLPS
jgi:type I restriction enzyme, S subunit